MGDQWPTISYTKAMSAVYFDESGNTGQNLLDEADPIFVLASCSFQPAEEVGALLHFQQFQGRELKFSRLRKTPAGQRAVLDFMRSPEVTSRTVAAVLVHKPFMIVTKYCDLVLEPSFRKAGLDFNRHGQNIATANLLTTIMPVFLNKITWHNFLGLFVRVVRERTPAVFNEWQKLAVLILTHLENAHPNAADFFAPVLLMQDCNELFRTLSADELDPLVPAYEVIVDYWGKAKGHVFDVLADESKALAGVRGHLLSLADPNLKPFSAGYDRRKIDFPLKVADIMPVDSTAFRQVQLADIISGALNNAARARTKGVLQSGTFAREVFEICLSKKIIINSMWPSHELDPAKLGTDVAPDPGEVDLATYASMILKGHPSTKKEE